MLAKMERKSTGKGIGQRSTICLERFRDAMEWRREAEKGLAGVGLTLSQWMILDATRFLIEATKDAVSQADVALHAQIDRMTVSQVMGNLQKAGLVDRGPAADGRAYRVVVTARGERAAKQGALQIEGASASWLGKRRPRGR
jgi:DNA-binding MarR family transcriptional regulator